MPLVLARGDAAALGVMPVMRREASRFCVFLERL